MHILDGKTTAAAIKAEIAQAVERLTASGHRRPHLAAVLVGHDGASETYVRNKMRSCEACGFTSSLVRFETSVTQQQLLDAIARLNADDAVDGFIVQLPLPAHIDEGAVIAAIDPDKDVDGFHPANIGRLSIGLPCLAPATPLGVLELLRRYNIPTQGAHCVIVGRSNIVGKPLASLMMQKAYGDATVTVCHRQTRHLADICRTADILVSAVGHPGIITPDMVRRGAVVVDVGITRVDDPSAPNGYRLLGDVRFADVAPKCSFITPVPGGVGPMTVAMLMQNTLSAAQKHGLR